MKTHSACPPQIQVGITGITRYRVIQEGNGVRLSVT